MFGGDFRIELPVRAGTFTGPHAVGQLRSAKSVERVDLVCTFCERLHLRAINTWQDGSSGCAHTRALQGRVRETGAQIDYLLVSWCLHGVSGGWPRRVEFGFVVRVSVCASQF